RTHPRRDPAMTEFTIIPYQPEYKDRVVALRRFAYNDDFRGCQEYIEWKYERNPYLDEPLIFIAVEPSGTVIGMRGFYGTRWRVGDENIVIPCADDFAIAAAWRNTGLMTAIMRTAISSLALRGFPYLLNSSGGSLTVLQSLAMGWKSLGAMGPVAALTRNERMFRELRRRVRGRRLVWRLGHRPDRLQFSDPRCFDRLDHAEPQTMPGGGSIVIEATPRPEAMARLVADLPHDRRVRHTRDTAFFTWRFQNPIRDYRFVYYERNDVLEGFMVVSRYPSYRPPMIPFHIADWEANGNDIRREMLTATLQRGRFTEIGAWETCMPAGCDELLRHAGFRPIDLELRARGMPCVLLKKIGDPASPSATLPEAGWDIRLIDSMHG
ncbi:MAG TPA: hypothetical protein VFX92_13880, partial [Candidatus Krumholzibacteria bacterium]|nr:hypothetical protein [Candidatus Krumholzibacteria bacterium]